MRASALRLCTRALLLALLVTTPVARSAAQQRTSYEELQTFSQVLTYIFHSYPDSVSYGVLIKSAIDGVLRDLDPHSLFISRLEYERLDSLERGVLAGTGADLDDIGGDPTVLGVYPRSPAEGAGVHWPGDELSLIGVIAFFGAVSYAFVQALRRRRAALPEGAAA